MKKPTVKLIGEDGNAFNIIGICKRAAMKAKWSDEKWKSVQDEFMSGNYNNLLRVASEHFNIK